MWCLHVSLISATGNYRRKLVEIVKCIWSLCSDKGNLLQTEYKLLQNSGVFNSLAFCFLINPSFLFARLRFNWIWVPFITVCAPEHIPERKIGTVLLKWRNSSLFGQNIFCKLYVRFRHILQHFWAKSYLDPAFSHSGQSSVHSSTRGHQGTSSCSTAAAPVLASGVTQVL